MPFSTCPSSTWLPLQATWAKGALSPAAPCASLTCCPVCVVEEPCLRHPLRTMTRMFEARRELPTITAQMLLEALISRGALEEGEVVSMLGESRHHLTLAALESAVLKSNKMSEHSLSALKGELAGRKSLATTRVPVSARLPEEVSRVTGSVVLDSQPLTVAMVEDLPDAVALVTENLSNEPFDIALCTISQFTELFRICYRGGAATAREQLPDIYQLFDEAERRRASDIHVSVGRPPALRVDGKLTELEYLPVDQEWMRSEVMRIAGSARLHEAEEKYDVDMAFPYGQSRFRINFGKDREGMTMAARKIPTEIPTPDKLGLPSRAQQFAALDRGLVVVTGATGSGKSTTLASLLALIGQSSRKHIITLEDPVEFHIPPGQSIVHQRELGTSFTTFPEGLRQALRQDPDVVLVGEMRDLETIRTALTAAETGHLVFGTLHTFDAPSTVSRIVSMYPPEEQDQVRSLLAYILKGIVAQTLLPLVSGSGRAAAYEIMVNTPAIANNLRKVDGHTQLRNTIETGARDGMQTMDSALAELVRRRIVSEEDAMEKVQDPEAFRRRLNAT